MLTDKAQRLAAEILVQAGYAKSSYDPGNKIYRVIVKRCCDSDQHQEVNPARDTLEGRRQADVIEKEWRIHTMPVVNGVIVWSKMLNGKKKRFDTESGNEARKLYIEYCLNKLAEVSNDNHAE